MEKIINLLPGLKRSKVASIEAEYISKIKRYNEALLVVSKLRKVNFAKKRIILSLHGVATAGKSSFLITSLFHEEVLSPAEEFARYLHEEIKRFEKVVITPLLRVNGVVPQIFFKSYLDPDQVI